MKKQKIQEELNEKNNNKKEKKHGFGEDLKQVWYEKSPLKILKRNMLFQTDGVMLKEN